MKMTFVKVVLGFILICAFYGCGDGGGAGAGSGMGDVKLIRSEPLGNNQYKYDLGLDARTISGSKSSPYVKGQFNCWKDSPISDSDGDGWYEVQIRAFNQEMEMFYGGDINDSSEGNRRRVAISLKDGAVFRKGETTHVLPSEIAGAKGDDTIRVGLGVGVMAVYFNNQDVCGSTTRPFHSGSYNGEAVERQAISDSSGWGKALIPSPIGSLPRTIEFRYGGDNTSPEPQDWSWVTVSDSSFFNRSTGKFRITIGLDGTVKPGF